jgi:hypothetical protein
MNYRKLALLIFMPLCWYRGVTILLHGSVVDPEGLQDPDPDPPLFVRIRIIKAIITQKM